VLQDIRPHRGRRTLEWGVVAYCFRNALKVLAIRAGPPKLVDHLLPLRLARSCGFRSSGQRGGLGQLAQTNQPENFTK
jgi:hypothetical protein